LRVRPNPEKLLEELLAWILQGAFARQWLELASVGSTMFNLNEQILGALPITLPTSRQEQQNLISSLADGVQRVDDLTAEATRAIDLLQERRTALISAAVTGKMDVRGVSAAEVA
jgi:type I restriction enzyme S subunit